MERRAPIDEGRARELLVKERERLASLWEQLNREGMGQNSLREGLAELSVVDQHPSDLGSETFERGKDLALRETTGRLLAQVEAALERLDRGEYGVCQACGRPIEAERLEALPAAERCRSCQEAMEQEPPEAARSRPVEEESLPASFSRLFGDEPEDVGLEGEDVWQEVARFGTANTPQDIPGAVDFDDAFLEGEEPQGATEPVEEIPDLRGNMATDWEALYPEPRPEAERTRRGTPHGERQPQADGEDEALVAGLDMEPDLADNLDWDEPERDG